ncbi:hypothetical protein NGB36_16645 [Streptomyces sp. RB6PN25]|uniref:Integral membrane protein n=1 Tax=Streptomyces humicola TaxID=2953240 RepID=A0ABT1PWZ7_9ACTN|nr:hypothetical protein [Streptomyces humicola]MCQ4082191.1 hypothetical protein [Streptomyces humicola]
MSRPVAAVGAAALIVEALVIAFVNVVLGLAVKQQSMSFGGIAPKAMSAGAFVAGALFALFLLVCAALLIRIAATDRAPGRLGSVVLIVCAVVHGVLGAAVVGIVGWAAFAAAMVVLGLLVWTLLSYARNGGSTNGASPTSP